MKKLAQRGITNPEQVARRVLRLSQETVRVLGSNELSQAVSGCDTTSWTTEKPLSGVC